MKQCLRFFFIGLITLLLALIVRTYVFNIYFIPTLTTDDKIEKAQVVAVRKWHNAPYKLGDNIAFIYTDILVGKLKGIPGQQVMLQGKPFRLPTYSKCFCHHCAHKGYYLVEVIDKDVLICSCDIVGKAYWLFNLDL